MAMLNNQMVYMCMCIYIYINGTTNRQNRQAPDKPIGATCHVDALYTDIWWICWFHSPSILHDLHCHLDCFKKQPGCPAARSWHRPAIKHEMLQKMGISNSNFQLRFPKKPPTTSMVSSMPKKPWLWKRPKACLGKTGAVPGARAAKVLEKHGNWVGFEGNFAGKLCFCMVLPWFLPFKMIEHVGFLEKCPKIAMPKGTQMKQVTFHCYAWLPQGWVYRMEMPCSYGFPPWENLSYQYH